MFNRNSAFRDIYDFRFLLILSSGMYYVSMIPFESGKPYSGPEYPYYFELFCIALFWISIPFIVATIASYNLYICGKMQTRVLPVGSKYAKLFNAYSGTIRIIPGIIMGIIYPFTFGIYFIIKDTFRFFIFILRVLQRKNVKYIRSEGLYFHKQLENYHKIAKYNVQDAEIYLFSTSKGVHFSRKQCGGLSAKAAWKNGLKKAIINTLSQKHGLGGHQPIY